MKTFAQQEKSKSGHKQTLTNIDIKLFEVAYSKRAFYLHGNLYD